jgi:hypothetical protein
MSPAPELEEAGCGGRDGRATLGSTRRPRYWLKLHWNASGSLRFSAVGLRAANALYDPPRYIVRHFAARLR